MAKVIEKCVPGARIYDICKFGDALIAEETGKTFTGKKIDKGLAFPVCISVNNICGHFSPLSDDDTVLAKGDVAKIDLGVHFDGFPTLLAHTIVVGEEQVTGVKADVILAAWNSLQAAVRVIKAGAINHHITANTEKICETYGVNPVEGVLSHEVMRHFFDGNNVILNKETPEHRVSEVEFQVNQIYGLDVIVSTGAGKPKEAEIKTTVYKRDPQTNYDLKTKNGRAFFSHVANNHPTMGFSLRTFEDELLARVGASECLTHGLLNSYPVLVEKKEDIVAQFKWTVLISAKRVILLSSFPMDCSKIVSDKSVSDQAIKDILAIDLDAISKKQKKPAAKKE